MQDMTMYWLYESQLRSKKYARNIQTLVPRSARIRLNRTVVEAMERVIIIGGRIQLLAGRSGSMQSMEKTYLKYQPSAFFRSVQRN